MLLRKLMLHAGDNEPNYAVNSLSATVGAMPLYKFYKNRFAENEMKATDGVMVLSLFFIL